MNHLGHQATLRREGKRRPPLEDEACKHHRGPGRRQRWVMAVTLASHASAAPGKESDAGEADRRARATALGRTTPAWSGVIKASAEPTATRPSHRRTRCKVSTEDAQTIADFPAERFPARSSWSATPTAAW